MEKFSEKISVNNKDFFKTYNNERIMSYLRKEIFEHIISEKEDCYFELDNFFSRYKITNKINMENITSEIMKELNILGWNTKTSYGKTALFIYSTDEPPLNCYEDIL